MPSFVKRLIIAWTREIWDWLARPEEFVPSESANSSVCSKIKILINFRLVSKLNR